MIALGKTNILYVFCCVALRVGSVAFRVAHELCLTSVVLRSTIAFRCMRVCVFEVHAVLLFFWKVWCLYVMDSRVAFVHGGLCACGCFSV